MDALILQNIRVVGLAVNLPGPVALFRLGQLGADVTKIEPPAGDPLEAALPAWYRLLCNGHRVVQIDLKSADGQTEWQALLENADVLLTSSRPATLERLGVDWEGLHRRWPRLCMVSIVGETGENANRPGHDLTFQAAAGLLAPPSLPRSLVADLAGAQEAVTSILGLLLARERGCPGGHAVVSLADAARRFADPYRYGLTAETGILGGALAGYNLYETADGWIALAALEPQFWKTLLRELSVDGADVTTLAQRFRTRTADEWEQWAAARDLPLQAVRQSPPL